MHTRIEPDQLNNKHIKKLGIEPGQLNNEHIQKLGQDFLEQDNKCNCWLSFFHRDDIAKERAVAGNLKNYDADTSAHDKWLFLAATYKGLPNNTCPLAKKIRRFFETSFECGDIPVSRMKPYRYRYGRIYERVEYPVDKVSLSLMYIVARRYPYQLTPPPEAMPMRKAKMS